MIHISAASTAIMMSNLHWWFKLPDAMFRAKLVIGLLSVKGANVSLKISPDLLRYSEKILAPSASYARSRITYMLSLGSFLSINWKAKLSMV